MTKAKINKELGNTKYQEIIEKRQELLHDISTLENEINQFISGISELSKYSQDELFNDKYMELITLSSRSKNLYDQAEYLKLLTKQVYFDKMVEKLKIFDSDPEALRKYLEEYNDLNKSLQIAKAATDGAVYMGRKYEDAAGLWVLMSSDFTRGLDYLNKNGKLIKHISDLDNPEFETIIRKKCKEQNFNTTDPKGIIFHKDSSLAKSIIESPEFKEIIWKNYKKLLVNKNELLNESISMEWNYMSAADFDISINNFLASHKCDILNLYIKNDLVYATILDTVDYNDWKVILPKLLQDNGIIKNYYFIINIEVPLEVIFQNDENNVI